MPDVPAFYSCWQRYRRADAHAKAFMDMWNAFTKDDPYTPSVHVEADGTGSIWVRCDRMPDMLPLYLGEMLYQLRAALDGCVYESVILETRKVPPPNAENLEFPITDSAERFKKSGWKMRPLSKQRRRMIEAVQPYNAALFDADVRLANETLGILNDWARKDRHRTLHVVGSWASRLNPMLVVPDGVRIVSLTTSPGGFFDEDHDYEVASFVLEGWKPGMEVEANPNLLLDIAVDEPPPLASDDDFLGARIHRMLTTVGRLILAFEQSFGADAPEAFRQPSTD